MFLTTNVYTDVFVPTPLVWGGTTYSNVFFFGQTILADQYMIEM